MKLPAYGDRYIPGGIFPGNGGTDKGNPLEKLILLLKNQDMISDLSQRVEIKRLILDEDFGFVEPETSEVSILTTVASIKEIKRSSAVQQQLNVENVNYKMTIRYCAGREIRKDDVIIWQGKRYKALTSSSPVEQDKKKFLETLIVIQDG